MLSDRIKRAGKNTMSFGRMCAFIIAITGLLCIDTIIMAMVILGYRDDNPLAMTTFLFTRIATSEKDEESNVLTIIAAICSNLLMTGLGYYLHQPVIIIGYTSALAFSLSTIFVGASLSTIGSCLTLCRSPARAPTIAHIADNPEAAVMYPEAHVSTHTTIISTLPIVISSISQSSSWQSTNQPIIPNATAIPSTQSYPELVVYPDNTEIVHSQATPNRNR